MAHPKKNLTTHPNHLVEAEVMEASMPITEGSIRAERRPDISRTKIRGALPYRNGS
jgi:hypothetical protein